MTIFYNKGTNNFKEEFTRLFVIGFGVFLFILFFQPFPLESLDFNSRLLYVAGFGVISFVLSALVLVVLPLVFTKWLSIGDWEEGPPFILIFMLVLFSSVGYSFYIYYVGKSNLSLYVLFKIILVSLIPVIMLAILYKNKSLERIIKELKIQNHIIYTKNQELEAKQGESKLNLHSATKSDYISLKSKDIIQIKSADNYVEIFFLDDKFLEKKIIRNTLKDIENQLLPYPEMIRCHRTSIVNSKHIHKLLRSYQGYMLKMNYLEDKVPVSRQYITLVRETLSALNQ